MSHILHKLEQEFRKTEIKNKYNLNVLSPTLGKARPKKYKNTKKQQPRTQEQSQQQSQQQHPRTQQ